MSMRSSMRRRLTGTLSRIRMYCHLAAERLAETAAKAPAPAEPEQQERPDIYRRALPEAQAYPPLLHSETPASVVAEVKGRAQERRERRAAKRAHEAHIAPLLARQMRALDNFRFSEAEDLERQIQKAKGAA